MLEPKVTFSITEDDLNIAIENSQKPNYKVCQECIVAVAAKRQFGDKFSSCFGNKIIFNEDYSEGYVDIGYITLSNVIFNFDADKFDIITEQLPLYIELDYFQETVHE